MVCRSEHVLIFCIAAMSTVGIRSAWGSCPAECPSDSCFVIGGEVIEFDISFPDSTWVVQTENPTGSESWDAAEWASFLGFQILNAHDPSDQICYGSWTLVGCNCEYDSYCPEGELAVSDDVASVVASWEFNPRPDLTQPGDYEISVRVGNNPPPPDQVECSQGGQRDEWFAESKMQVFTLHVREPGCGGVSCESDERCCYGEEYCIPADEYCWDEVCEGSQSEPGEGDDAIDSRGTEFLVTFFPNMHYDTPNYFFDRNEIHTLEIHLTADECTVVTVQSSPMSISPTEYSVSPGHTTIVNIPMEFAESHNDSSGFVQDSESVVIELTSNEKPFSCSLHNLRQYSSDSARAIPTNALGTEYMLSSPYASLFAVIATEDSTYVTIDGTQWTLDRGQEYYYAGGDAVGTHITANKPIAVFQGASCQHHPWGLGACDHLFETALPVNNWATEYVAPAVYYPKLLADEDGSVVDIQHEQRDVFYRITARHDDTTVWRDGVQVSPMIDKGEYIELEAGATTVFAADRPISVIQMGMSEDYHDGEISPFGINCDPFIQTLIPTKYFTRHTVFRTVDDTYTVGFDWPAYDAHYATIVAYTTDIDAGAVILDDEELLEANVVGTDMVGQGTGLTVVTVALEAGEHEVWSDKPHMAYLFGFAHFESYAYPGDFCFAHCPEAIPPVVTCGCLSEGNVVCTASDERSEDINGDGDLDDGEDTLNANGRLDIDSGVASVEAGEPWENLTLAVDEFTPGDASVSFTISRDMPENNAYGVVVVTDRKHNKTAYEVYPPIAGIALKEYSTSGPRPPLPEENGSIYVNECTVFVADGDDLSEANPEYTSTGLLFAWDVGVSGEALFDATDARGAEYILSLRSDGDGSGDPCALAGGDCSDYAVGLQVMADGGQCTSTSTVVSVRDLGPTGVAVGGPRGTTTGSRLCIR